MRTTEMLVTGNQLKAARSLAGVEQIALAEKAGVHVNTIRKIEAKGTAEITSAADVVRRIQQAAESFGIEFLNHGQPGVRLRKAPPAIATQIEALEGKIATIPDADQPSPEAAMNVMRKAVAENQLADLKGRQGRPKRK